LSGYELVAADSLVVASVPNGQTVQAAVACSEGKVPVAGGFEPLPQPTPGSVVFLNLISSAPTANGWSVTLRNGSGTTRSNVQFRVWGVCSVAQQ
jgi:hypothetical protein